MNEKLEVLMEER